MIGQRVLTAAALLLAATIAVGADEAKPSLESLRAMEERAAEG